MAECCSTGWTGARPTESSHLTINTPASQNQPAPEKLHAFFYCVGSEWTKIIGGVLFDIGLIPTIVVGSLSGLHPPLFYVMASMGVLALLTNSTSTAVSAVERGRFGYSNSEILRHVGKSALITLLPCLPVEETGMPAPPQQLPV